VIRPAHLPAHRSPSAWHPVPVPVPKAPKGSRGAGRAGGRRRAPELVYLEIGQRRVFAAALDWPGWCRPGRDEQAALEALSTYAERFEPVASRAGLPFRYEPAAEFDVRERLAGSATTDFGAPGAVRPDDDEPMALREIKRTLALLQASWATFADVVASAPATLREGPRGGGRDRGAIAEHVVGAEVEYARKLGLARRKLTAADAGAVEAMREEIAGALRALAGGGRSTAKGWPARYAARRLAWHVLDPAWEIEDKSS